LAEPSDSLADFTLRFVAVPGDPRPLGVRVRLLLKYALWQCSLRNAGFVDVPPLRTSRPAVQ
jgi:hypothetical protein